LGYKYPSLKGQSWNLDTDIFPELFSAAITRINPGIEADDVSRLPSMPPTRRALYASNSCGKLRL